MKSGTPQPFSRYTDGIISKSYITSVSHSQEFQKTHFDHEVEVTEILSPLTFLVNAPVVSISENLTSDREVSEIQTPLTSLPVVSIRGSYVFGLLHSQT